MYIVTEPKVIQQKYSYSGKSRNSIQLATEKTVDSLEQQITHKDFCILHLLYIIAMPYESMLTYLKCDKYYIHTHFLIEEPLFL